MYVADLDSIEGDNLSCLSAQTDEANLWHRGLGHGNKQDHLSKPRKESAQPDLWSFFTWTYVDQSEFKADEDETAGLLITFAKAIQLKVNCKIASIKSDHGTEFENSQIEGFCSENGINHNFSAPRTPQQNGVVERKNITLVDIARTMQIDSGVAMNFWAEANMCLIRFVIKKTPYELLNDRKPSTAHIKPFGCKGFVLNNGKDDLGKFDARSDEGVFVGYSSTSKSYRVFNKRTLCVEESMYVIFDESEKWDEHKEDHELEELINRKQDDQDTKENGANHTGVLGPSGSAQEEEVYVKQPSCFEDAELPNRMLKLDKVLYGLKQTPRAWYERLSKFLLANEFKRGKIDNTLFLNSRGKELLIVQVYVDDIIFEATSDSLCKKFADLMSSEFEMSMMGELTFFLDGVEVNQTMYRGIIGSLLYLTASRPNIVFSVGMCARFQVAPKESHLKSAKRILRYLKGTQDLVLFYHIGDSFDLIGYVDVDYAGFIVDRKSTSGMTHFLGSSLISWGTKKQNFVALSTTEAEYVIVASCCAQLLWIKQQLEDFGVLTDTIPLICDNTSAMNMAKNPVQHKRTKHIDMSHHFLRDNVEKQNMVMKFCKTED
ncbi:hypothetical protein KY285_015613 [Solanum tuberosum]|nr:hypothetical protein KY285_015613 [Solanum tuberosum]